MKRLVSAKLSWRTGTAIVIANMIGAGVFTSLGFQLEDISNTWTILFAWFLGGVIALAGAFAYAEVGTSINESGGEYTFLSKIFHPVVGYLSGWISLSVGFAAPVALAAIAFSKYSGIVIFDYYVTSIVIILLISLIHCINSTTSAYFQNVSTLLKVGLIILIIICGIYIPPNISEQGFANYTSNSSILSIPYAIALIYVSYSYTGWNASAYIIQEFKNVKRDVPRSLILGTIVVIILYVLLQYVFLKHASISELKGNVEVGAIAIKNMLGPTYGKLINSGIALFLVSSISAMIWVGPRVSNKMGQDHKLWSFLYSGDKIPVNAIFFQASLSILLILTGTFEQILIYCGIL
ncbi:MAG: APC family permease, partial [Bacteroidota bacterium]